MASQGKGIAKPEDKNIHITIKITFTEGQGLLAPLSLFLTPNIFTVDEGLYIIQ